MLTISYAYKLAGGFCLKMISNTNTNNSYFIFHFSEQLVPISYLEMFSNSFFVKSTNTFFIEQSKLHGGEIYTK